jgi:phospholipid/cholesterol/gamma-HCH transport system substrate-binding protein
VASPPKAVELRVGLLVLAALAILAFGSLWIVGSFPIGPGRKTYQVAMSSSGGVRQGDRVRISGVEVGRIEDVTLRPGQEWPVLFNVVLDPVVKVGEEASARIATEGLLGANYLEIDVGPASTPELAPGSTIYQGASAGIDGALAGLDALTGRAVELLDQVSLVMDRLADDLEPLLEQATQLLSDRNIESFSNTLATMETVVEENRPLINSMFQRFDALALRLEESTVELPELARQVTGLVEDLQAALGEDGERLATLIETAEATVLSAGETFETLSQNRQVLEGSLEDLEVTMTNLKELSRLLRDRPSSLIRNYTPPDRRPGDPKGRP